LILDAQSPLILEGRNDADDIRKQGMNSALSTKRSMFARNEDNQRDDHYYARTDRHK